MYLNTFINLEENVGGYGKNQKRPSGHITITTPGVIKCYIQDLSSMEKPYIVYLVSKAMNKAIRLGALNAPTTTKQTIWKVDMNSVQGSQVEAKDIDCVLVLVEGDGIGNTDTVLSGYAKEKYLATALIEEALPKVTLKEKLVSKLSPEALKKAVTFDTNIDMKMEMNTDIGISKDKGIEVEIDTSMAIDAQVQNNQNMEQETNIDASMNVQGDVQIAVSSGNIEENDKEASVSCEAVEDVVVNENPIFSVNDVVKKKLKDTIFANSKLKAEDWVEKATQVESVKPAVEVKQVEVVMPVVEVLQVEEPLQVEKVLSVEESTQIEEIPVDEEAIMKIENDVVDMQQMCDCGFQMREGKILEDTLSRIRRVLRESDLKNESTEIIEKRILRAIDECYTEIQCVTDSMETEPEESFQADLNATKESVEEVASLTGVELRVCEDDDKDLEIEFDMTEEESTDREEKEKIRNEQDYIENIGDILTAGVKPGLEEWREGKTDFSDSIQKSKEVSTQVVNNQGVNTNRVVNTNQARNRATSTGRNAGTANPKKKDK